MNFKAWFALLGICLCCGCSTLRQVDELPPDLAFTIKKEQTILIFYQLIIFRIIQ